LLIQPAIVTPSYILLLFIAILLTSVLGGLGPGLSATILICAAAYYCRPSVLTASQLRQLGIEGILVSIVGGTLRVARTKASERLTAYIRLEQQILEIGDEERRRIGHDLHDGLGQHLTGISLLSETIAQQLDAGRQPDPTNVETITRLVSEAVRITRDLAKSLSPVTLETDGLLAALEELADTASGLFGIECDCEIEAEEVPLNRSRSLHVFRIVQEAVNNSVRHGKAKHVKISLITDAQTLKVTIHDDGSGLSQKTMANPGLGLRIMQYRARMLDASLTIVRANEAGGTIVTCICPIDQNGN
ncbi:MAG TPA: sensor histidine kinase, partial [Tepidisphaeraceae bacterium]|nr:sensor histidine kinase [Tepidisphaeraceae bacterium]